MPENSSCASASSCNRESCEGCKSNKASGSGNEQEALLEPVIQTAVIHGVVGVFGSDIEALQRLETRKRAIFDVGDGSGDGEVSDARILRIPTSRER